VDRLHGSVKIILVGKYTDLHDSYISVVKSLEHASLACNRKLQLEWVEATDLELSVQAAEPIKYHEAWQKLCSGQGILVPGGFGERGTEGKIMAIKWARENNIPFLGICLGLQLAVIEFARNVLNMKGISAVLFLLLLLHIYRYIHFSFIYQAPFQNLCFFNDK